MQFLYQLEFTTKEGNSVEEKLGITIKVGEKHLSQSKNHLRKQLEPKYVQFAVINSILLN